MQGKRVLVTGGSDGIGKETARQLAVMGAAITITGRNPEKTAAAVAELRQATGSQEIDYLLGDFAELAQVRELAAQYRARYDQLDVLVNNAGAVFLRRGVTRDGYERTLGVNHLAPFLLTGLLLDMLKANTPSRIVNVSSGAHRRGDMDFDDLQYETGYQAMEVYGRSKLANVLFTYELARRLVGSGVMVNALHPGLVRTNFAANNGWLVKLIAPLVMRRGISVEAGAATSVYLASSPDVAEVTGKYFEKSTEKKSSEISYDEAVQKQLWAWSEEQVSV